MLAAADKDDKKEQNGNKIGKLIEYGLVVAEFTSREDKDYVIATKLWWYVQ